MAETPYNHYALYEPDASPDLTETGEYNRAIMGIDSDMHTEQIEREHADKLLDERIDNAEVEISANSADLTGIKSLTYGNEHVQFLEHDNGSYSSPALDEIDEQMTQRMTCIQIPVGTTTIDMAKLNTLNSDWPNVALLETGPDIPYFPYAKEDSEYYFSPICGQYSGEGEPYARGISIAKTGKVSRFRIENNPYWENVELKPFSTIGHGLKVENDALTVDASAVPTGITPDTQWGTIEA